MWYILSFQSLSALSQHVSVYSERLVRVSVDGFGRLHIPVHCISGRTQVVSYMIRASYHEEILEHHMSIGEARRLRCHEAVTIGARRVRSGRRRSTVHSMKRCGTDDGPEARVETSCLWRLSPSRPHSHWAATKHLFHVKNSGRSHVVSAYRLSPLAIAPPSFSLPF